MNIKEEKLFKRLGNVYCSGPECGSGSGTLLHLIDRHVKSRQWF